MSKNIIKYIILISAFFCVTILNAQKLSDNFKFGIISIDEGLSSSSVNCIIQDSKGFLWIGTEDGLNRFDGYSFKVFRNRRGDKYSLSNNFIWSLFEDKSGNIWIGTDGGGLNKYDPVTDKFFRFAHDPKDPKSINSDAVQCVYQDALGNIYVGTWGQGLNLYDAKSNSFLSFRNNPQDKSTLSNDKVFCVFEDDHNNIWIGTDGGGLNLFDRKSNTFKRFTSTSSTLTSNAITCIFQYSSSELYLGTSEGYLIKFNTSDYSSLNLNLKTQQNSPSQNSIWKILDDPQGLIWIATMQEGIFILDPNTSVITNLKFDSQKTSGLSSNNLRYLYRDKTDNIWIGTLASGLNKINMQKSAFYKINLQSTAGQLTDNFIFSLCEDKVGNIWIGTLSDGAFKFNPSTNRINNYPPNSAPRGLSGGIIRYIFKDKVGDLWLGTYYGILNKYSYLNDSFEQIDLDFNNDNPDAKLVRVIFEDSDSLLWFGLNGNGGVVTYDRKTKMFNRYSTSSKTASKLSGDEVLSICEDKDGFIWIGTYSYGLNKFDKRTRTFKHYQREENNLYSLPENIIPELYCDSDGNLWVGTYSSGLCKYDYKQDNFSIYTEDNGLINNSIFGIVEDGNKNLWISGSKGISKYNKKENSFTNFDYSFGIQKGDFNPSARCKTEKGWIYFGGVNGVTYFHPDSIKISSRNEKPTFTSFKVYNREINLLKSIAYVDTIILNYNDNFFSFEFVLPELTAPDKIQYAYQMAGLSDEWIKTGNSRFVNFTHLDPGEYFFKVKSTNIFGVWTENIKQVMVIITPPFWMTWWFRSMIILLFISTGPLIYYRRVTRLKKEQQIQIEFSKQLIKSQEDERKRVASELHDSLGQDLLVIKNLALLNKNKSDQFDEISKVAGTAIDEVRRISYNLHPYQLDRLGLTRAISSMFSNLENVSSVNFNLQIDDIDGLFSKEQEINIYRIIQECINNIIKHSAAEKAMVTAQKWNAELLLEISDNGKGFNFEAAKLESKGFGLKSLNNRVSFLGGNLEFGSSKNYKTQIKVRIPIS